jgi:hypothetical protein
MVAERAAVPLEQEFYEKRTSTKNASIKEHREAHKLLGDQKPEGKNEWERAIRCARQTAGAPGGRRQLPPWLSSSNP